jgi:hypothetical protein
MGQPPKRPLTLDELDAQFGVGGNATAPSSQSRVGVWTDIPRSRIPDQVSDDVGAGIWHGAAKSALGLAELGYTLSLGDVATYLANLATGANINPRQALRDLAAHPALQSKNEDQRAGETAERLAEFAAIPATKGPFLVRSVAQGAMAAGVAALQGGDARTVGMAALLGAAIPGGSAVVPTTGKVIESTAVPIVRSALKPTVAATKKEVGVGMAGLNATADRLAKFIVDRRLMSFGDAQRAVRSAEFEVRKAVRAAGNPITDAAQQAEAFLIALRDKVAKADKPELTAIVQGEIDDLYRVNGQMSKSVPVIDPATGLQAVDKNGVPLTTQELRTDISTEEARALAGASSKYVTRDTWGEAGRSMHQLASKTKESGVRQSVRDAVPAAVSHLKEESRAISARQQLDRMGFRQGNNNIVDLPSVIMAAPKIAGGHLPLLSVAMTWFRRNKLRAGVMADALGTALQNQDAKTVAEILMKLGVGAEIQAEIDALPKPVASHEPSATTLPDGEYEMGADGKLFRVR